MEEKILDEILKNTYTADAFKSRYQALRLELQGKIYRAESAKAAGSEAEELPGGKEAEWLRGFDKELMEKTKSEDFNRVSEYLEQYLSGLPPLSIYLVFLPDSKQIKEIGEYLRKLMNNPKLLFNIKIDPGLIGGCAIVYKGVYKDYSLKGRITARKGELIDEFRKYFKS